MRSAASSVPPREPFTFFVDRSLGSVTVAKALRGLGEEVRAHDDLFPQDTDDVVYLREVGESGWVLLTKDKNIRRNELERAALIGNGVAAFVLTGGNLTGTQMAEAFVVALPRIKRALLRFEPPFVATVSAAGAVSIIMDAKGVLSRPRVLK